MSNDLTVILFERVIDAHSSYIYHQRAFNALCHSTHLYGRRLVLEWAQAEESLEDLRKKTAQHFSDGNWKAYIYQTNLHKNLIKFSPLEEKKLEAV